VRISTLVMFLLTMSFTACTAPRIILLSDPLDAREYNDLGVAYEASGEKELALEAYASAFAKDRSWDQPLINYGNVHAALGNWSHAETSYRQALARNPTNPEAMNNLAYALLQQGSYLESIEWSAKALEIESNNPLFKSTKALALLGLGERGRAHGLFEEVLRSLSEDDPLRERIWAILAH
jgi:tetratricopeptide (TPR) repeat protein